MINYFVIAGIKAPLSFKYDEYSINQQVDLVFDVVCKYFGLTRQEICSRCRKNELVIPRHILIWFLRNRSKLTLKKIGNILGLDHSTVIHACKRVELMRDEKLNYPEKIHFDKLLKLM